MRVQVTKNRSRDQTSRVLLLKFEVVLKPNCFSDQFQTYRVLLVYLKLVYPEVCTYVGDLRSGYFDDLL